MSTVSKNKIRRVLLEDWGQDLQWFDIEQLSDHLWAVKDCGPFHSQLYTGWFVVTKPRVGGTLSISKGPNNPILKIKYPIEHVRLRTERDYASIG